MQFLQQLQLQKENEGTSTGAAWLKSKGTIISSYSPVDGNLIGSVTTTDQAAYAQLIEAVYLLQIPPPHPLILDWPI